ncbi:MAG: hypothetical protein JRF33_16510 [Deltaproteobacteria bacterium]|nr:hypothetical protein [Deltaproteobacteria bacterium]
MRIAAGILLIIAAIFNVIAGGTYAAAGFAGSAIEEADKAAGGDAKDALDAVKKAAGEAATEGAADAQDVAAFGDAVAGAQEFASTKGLFFGLFLLVLFVLQIVCAILLFIGKAKTFILVVAGLSILAEIGGVVLFAIVSFGFTNIFGVLGGGLAIAGAMGIGKVKDAPPAAPAEG